MSNMGSTGGQMGGQKKGNGTLFGSIIIIIIIIIAGIYMFKNAKIDEAGDTMMQDEVSSELNEQGEGDTLGEIEGDLENTNLEEVVPATTTEEASQ